jgi:ATP-dependent Lon protease
MQESAKAALTWIRAHVGELGLTDARAESLLNTTDLHIHFPEGAVPKDGPSAGVTITTALCSLLTGRLVRHDVAMTGEVRTKSNIKRKERARS